MTFETDFEALLRKLAAYSLKRAQAFGDLLHRFTPQKRLNRSGASSV